MSENKDAAPSWGLIKKQPGDVRVLSEHNRNELVVSAIQVDGHWVILSRYSDDIWHLNGFSSNTADGNKQINFKKVPVQFKAVMKAIIYRYLQRGREGQRRPRGSTLSSFFTMVRPFLKFLDKTNIKNFGAVTPIVCTSYADERKRKLRNGKQLGPTSIYRCLIALDGLYELSQYTHDPILSPPWLNTSAQKMAGLSGSVTFKKTPLIPDKVFCNLFQKASENVERGKALLVLRDTIDEKLRKAGTSSTRYARDRLLTDHGWEGGPALFNRKIIELRTACYIVLASTSGCRNHELANLQSGAHHRTEDEEGTVYHWMRSKSEKTDAGTRDWMIPKAAVQALRLMQRWAEPYQLMIAREITARRKKNPRDPEIAKALQQRHALFLGVTRQKSNKVRILSNTAWNLALKEYAQAIGLDWSLATHQFRRKFANYAAHSKFGDLRYLREHYAHCSMDMTLGYAMDQDWGVHLDIELYDDIHSELEEIKIDVVDTWLSDQPLSGGYGRAIKGWLRTPANLALYKSHAAMVTSIAESTAIRSNGHAWCTADNDGCVGNTLERTRCGGCNHGVIGHVHRDYHQGLYDNLKSLQECHDIGDSGRARIQRDLERSREVLVQLGYDPDARTDD